MSRNEVVLRFDAVDFRYEPNKPILDEVSFSVRRNSKITVMGQNGGGKSTIFGLITGAIEPDSGRVLVSNGLTVAEARQSIPQDELDLTIREFFQKAFADAGKAKRGKEVGTIYDIDPRIDKVLEVVNLKGHENVHNRPVHSFSGGQQARILLASALIQKPDILLLDEPTNNLDKDGIDHLTQYVKDYSATVIVISHDSDFLNSFTDGVLYLDVFTQKVGQYVGNYFDVVEQIGAQVEKENRKNAQLSKKIQENKDKANFFAHKGGRMRLLAKRMKTEAEELEESKVDVKRDDKTIRPFKIPFQEGCGGDILTLSEFTVINQRTNKEVKRKAGLTLKRDEHLLLKGPNGIGKTTLLESIVNGTNSGSKIQSGVKIGFYRQDFSNLNFKDTVYQSLMSVMEERKEETMRSTAAGFLITQDIINNKVGDLSDGQKGLVAFARLVLQKPGLLILDEPTNHINFRHIPIIAEALSAYKGPMILVSHVPEFVEEIRIDEVLDLGR
ncbi:MAG: ABC-F family ATP-binding cassette domain-containing protein [Patescibacteria group bacterium]